MFSPEPTFAHPTAAAMVAPDADTRRRCVVTREVAPKVELVRFVVGPDGKLVPDVGERLPGRGLWIAARRDIVAAARSGAISKAARAQVAVPDGLAEDVESLLVRRCKETLGLARRAGEAVAGFDRVREWLRAGRGRVILAAVDGARGGREKMRGQAPSVPMLSVLSRFEIGEVFGRDECAHAVVASKSLGDRLIYDGRRLAGFREAAVLISSERFDERE